MDSQRQPSGSRDNYYGSPGLPEPASASASDNSHLNQEQPGTAKARD